MRSLLLAAAFVISSATAADFGTRGGPEPNNLDANVETLRADPYDLELFISIGTSKGGSAGHLALGVRDRIPGDDLVYSANFSYFTGIGKTKRIVLFDTLLGSHTEDEILAVIAHEIGHWKKKHLLKQLLILEIVSLAGFYLLSRLLNWTFIYSTFGFEAAIPYVGLFLLECLVSPLGYFVQPLESAISRRFEWEADDYSLGLMGTPEPICGALKRLASDNLSNLLPHPVYAWFYYSHPPLIDRLSRL